MPCAHPPSGPCASCPRRAPSGLSRRGPGRIAAGTRLARILRGLALSLAAITAGAGCATTIAPDRVAKAEAPSALRERSLARWEEAVALVNQYLDEHPRLELPPFRLEMTGRGMRLRTPDGEQDFRVACTAWGWLVTRFGFTAQERSWGFVVGPDGDGDPVLANTFFRGGLFGGWRSAESLGGLILHEAVHTVSGQGTVGFVPGLRYYAASLVHGGSDTHPDERLAYAIERDFRGWAARRRASESATPPETASETASETVSETASGPASGPASEPAPCGEPVEDLGKNRGKASPR